MNPENFNELARLYVEMWNERNPERRNQYVKDLWAEDGIECTKARLVQGHAALMDRVTASHEKNVRDAGFLFRSQNNADGHHGLARFSWQMFGPGENAVEASGGYLLLLNEAGKIRQAWLFVDP